MRAQPLRYAYDVDLIIRGSENMPLTRRLLRSMYASRTKLKVQVIYIDGGSDKTDLTQTMLDYPEEIYISIPHNTGSVRALNIGLSYALMSNAPYVILLDNDCAIPPDAGDWLERWLDYFSNDRVAAVGAVSNKAAGLQFSEKRGERLPDEDVPVLDNFAIALRKTAIERTGLFDERFEPGALEDIDYLIRLHEKGWEARVAADVWVEHKGGETLKQFDIPRLMQSNIEKLQDKHGAEKLKRFGLEITENKPQPPDKRKISLLVPTLNRPEKLKAMLNSVRPLVEADGNIEVVVAPMEGEKGGRIPDYPWIKIFPRPESEKLAVPGFNWCYRHATGDILVVGGDDVSYINPDFFKVIREEIAQLPDGEGMAESRTGQHGELEAMQALTRGFVEKELGGYFMYPGYRSWYGNSEQTARAMRAGRHRLTNRAIVASPNPVLDGTPPDDTYRNGEQWHEADKKLFMSRMAQGFPNDMVTVDAVESK